jgi:hypothetical protein
MSSRWQTSPVHVPARRGQRKGSSSFVPFACFFEVRPEYGETHQDRPAQCSPAWLSVSANCFCVRELIACATRFPARSNTMLRGMATTRKRSVTLPSESRNAPKTYGQNARKRPRVTFLEHADPSTTRPSVLPESSGRTRRSRTRLRRNVVLRKDPFRDDLRVAGRSPLVRAIRTLHQRGFWDYGKTTGQPGAEPPLPAIQAVSDGDLAR